MKETEMSMKKKKTTKTTIPVELIMEILSYLPAKSLMNSSKLVCKSWRSVIKEPDFVKMHLNRGAINGGGGGGTSSSNSQSTALLCKSGKGLFKLHLPLNISDDDDDDDDTVTIKPTQLFDSLTLFNSRVVASCNGLVCIGCDDDEFLILVNPCTRRYKSSPREPFQYLGNILKKCMPTSYGFGCFYDSTPSSTTTTTTTTTVGRHEYKVVRIAHSNPKKSEVTSKSDVKVYSMSTNSWRRVTDIPNDILEMITKTTNNQSGVFLNGALHWMNHDTTDLVSFDMRSEEFQIMSRPPPYDAANNDIKVLMVMRGCLGMIRIRRLRGSWDLEISLMKEYGVNESWTHESVIRLNSSQVGLSGMILFIVCLDGQILIQEMGGRLVLYDMKKKMNVYLDIQFPELARLEDDMVPCIESLVSLKSSSPLTLTKDKKRKVETTLHTEIK